MEIIDWGGGLTLHEIKALEQIKLAFSNKAKVVKDFKDIKNNIQSIFPWKGYSGFRFADVRERKEGEFDLVIVTHCIVLIVELKHWNGGKVTSHKDRWYLDKQERGRSAVSVTRNKKFLLENKLNKFKQYFTNKGFCPQVHFLVVITGNADFSELPDQEKMHVLSLETFLDLKNEHKFNARFRPHPNSKTLNQDFELFDTKIFSTDMVKPKPISIGGYYADDKPIFVHPNNIYQEYFAQSEHAKQKDIALFRCWNFTKIKKNEAQTPDGRFRLVSREYDILQHIKQQNIELYRACLNYKTMPQKSEITAEHIDVFELFPQQKRFNQFVGGYAGQNLTTERRLNLVKLLLNKFAQLHAVDIAHRDLGENSIWLSADDQIMLSGFATAYFASEKTVGDIRDILAVSGDLARDIFPLSNNANITPYQLDVRSLAVLAWHIVQAERISSESLIRMKKDLAENTSWYISVFDIALSGTPFENAQEFLDAFNQATPEQVLDFTFDFSKLEPFYHEINHSRAYPEDDEFIIESDEKEVYRSSCNLIKVWLGADPRQNNQEARIVFTWLKNIAKLAQISPDYLPKISDFGIARKSSSLFTVSEFIEDSLPWWKIIELDLIDERKFSLINKLIHNIEHLHDLGFTHGDLKPDNVLVNLNDEDDRLYILDILDFAPNGERLFNTEYSLPFEYATEIQNDNFAVIKMASELLKLSWNMPSEKFVGISEVIRLENTDSKTGFLSLLRFKEALNPPPKKLMINLLISGCDSFLPLQIYPDDGELLVQFVKSDHGYDILIKFIGLGGVLNTFYSTKTKKIIKANLPILRDYIKKRDRDHSEMSLPFGLNISYSHYNDFNELNNLLDENEIFLQKINEFIAKSILREPDPQTSDDSMIKDDPNLNVESVSTGDDRIVSQRPSIQKLWQAILDTETEAMPAVTASGKLQQLDDENIYIPYDGEVNPLDKFKKDEVIEVIGRDDYKDRIFKYGVVDFTKSNLNELHLKAKNLNKNTDKIEEKTPIYLQSKRNKASYQRRKNALQRILDGGSVIKELAHYFDEHCIIPANDYGIIVKDEHFARYDRQGMHGEKVTLNEAQRQAFQRLINNGPLVLLQGPPGTGKTEFIAAFVHYLFEQQKVKNILLVSQSHEAVNTAAERIRKHCRRLQTDLQIVRFSNREQADSEELEDVFSPNLVGQKRHQLSANKIDNICQLGRAMGLPEAYLRERAQWQFSIGVQIRRYFKLSNNFLSDEDEQHLIESIEQSIRIKAEELGLENVSSLDIKQIFPNLITQLDGKYNIQPVESTQAEKLIDLTQDMLEALSNERANYDEFLARSRQLIVGTCVGIGQQHIGIADNIYDWVIVDEAARSISSELAIAMQTGKRILLVGDHKQLPPLYSNEHKNALARRLGISKRGEELDQILGSDFERVFESAYGKQTCATLKTQYRMAPAIGSLVSACFYDGILENGKKETDIPDIYYNLPQSFQCSVTWLDTTRLPNSYHKNPNNSSSSINRAEADVVIQLLQDLANDETFMDSEIIQKCLDTNTKAIGVICMYGEQKKLISQKFNEKTWTDTFRRLVKIDSVDGYQGKENRIIILSLSRHDKQYKEVGFLYLPNRINVALSRAMDKLIIVGAAAMWQSPRNNKLPLGRVLNFIKEHVNDDYAFISLSELNTSKRSKK